MPPGQWQNMRGMTGIIRNDQDNHNFTIPHCHQNLQVNKPRPRPVKTTLSVRACCRLPSCRKAHFLNHASTSHLRIEKGSFLMLFYGTVCIDAASVRFSDLSGVQAHSNLSSEGLQAAVVPLLLS